MTIIKRANNLFPTFWNDFFEDDFFESPKLFGQKVTVPSVNVKENNKEYKIDLAAPGKNKKDFNINVESNVLTISSESKDEIKDENENYTRREFNYEAFSRSFTLPESVNTDAISATYKDGVLRITLPKKDADKSPKKLIEVK